VIGVFASSIGAQPAKASNSGPQIDANQVKYKSELRDGVGYFQSNTDKTKAESCVGRQVVDGRLVGGCSLQEAKIITD
jgi:hypothetical protein